MAIAWLTILSNVPWSDVIKNAPAVAEGAKKLWKKVGSRASTVTTAPIAGSEATPEAQLASLQARVAELQAQMLAASELVQSLAEQNAQLIARVEANRRRMVFLTICTGLVAWIAVAAWFH